MMYWSICRTFRTLSRERMAFLMIGTDDPVTSECMTTIMEVVAEGHVWQAERALGRPRRETPSGLWTPATSASTRSSCRR